jgi:hypothetical protein
MRIGQIVFIENRTFVQAQTGIIVRKEYEKTLEEWWYEVLCNDGCNHVIPGRLLSLVRFGSDSIDDNSKNKLQKLVKIEQACTKAKQNQLYYIHNQKQNLNFHSANLPHSHGRLYVR